MTQLRTILTATAAIAALSAGTAFAQDYNGTQTPPAGNITTAAPVVTSTSSATSGDSTTAPFQNFFTTTTNQTVSTSTAPTTNGVTATPAQTGTTVNQFGQITVSGTGTQGQQVVSVITNTYSAGPPQALTGTTGPVVTTNNVGSPTVTAVSASGYVGAMGSLTASQGGLYGSNLSTSGTPNAAGAVTATQNSILVTTGGTTYSQYTGTATYNPSTGAVTVALGATPTARTTTNANGLTTTGSVSAASMSTSALNMNGGRITNLGAGVAATDAVNVGQLNSAVTAINASISGLNSSVSSLQALVNNNRKRSDAGIATAVAMSGGVFLPNKKFNLTANIGGFRDEVAVSAQLGVLLSENIALNAGVATSLHSYGGTAYRGGLTFGF